MATREEHTRNQLQGKYTRYFSDALKRQAVRDIERGAFTVGEVSRQYSVSRTSVYRWIYRYSTKLVKGTYQIVEKKSQTAKVKALEERIKELERLVGTKQIQLEFTEKMLELGSEMVGFDIKKKVRFPSLCYYWQNREEMKVSLNRFYGALGEHKQNFHRRLNRSMRLHDEQAQLDRVITQIRQDHQAMSARKMYSMIRPACMGRDQFISYCRQQGWMLERKRNYKRTTFSGMRYENLIAGRRVTAVNQVWASDITYVEVLGDFHYVTFITDLYSRRIIGWSVSNTLRTVETTYPALEQALKVRSPMNLEGLIFHSDGGGQYYEKTFTKLLQQQGIKSSMAYSVYENAHAECINGVIKNEYLKFMTFQDIQTLQESVRTAVFRYNYKRPHGNLAMKTPIQIERSNPKYVLKIHNFKLSNQLTNHAQKVVISI